MEPEEVQQNEITALKSIFENDFREVPPPKAWKGVTAYPEFAIRVKASDPSLAEHVSFLLGVRFSKTYPKVIPTLTFKEPLGLKPNHLKQLATIARSEAESAIGDAMIFQIVTACQEWITTNHASPSLTPTASLATEMTRRAHREQEVQEQLAAEEADHARQQELESKAILAQQIEIDGQKKKEKKRAEKEQRKARNRAGSFATTSEMESTTQSVQTFEKEITLSDKIHFTSVKTSRPRKEYLGVTYMAEPIVEEGQDVPSLELHIVTFDTPYYSSPQGMSRLKKTSQALFKLTLIRHPNLQAVYAVQVTPPGNGRLPKLLILTEERPSMTLEELLQHCDVLRPEKVREYLAQLLKALQAVHVGEVTHQALTARSIRLGSGGVILCDVAFPNTIMDLYKSNPFGKPEASRELPESWLAPEAVHSPLAYPVSRDVWCLGVVLLQMLLGPHLIQQYPEPQDALSDSAVAEEFRTLASAFFDHRRKKPLPCYMLLELLSSMSFPARSSAIAIPGLKTPVPRAQVSHSPETSYFRATTPARGPRQSRYHQEWEELEFLGKGGFGSVVKARNKVDGHIYAVKKVKLLATENDPKIFREVRALSRLSHRSIVRYITAWVEVADLDTSSGSDDDNSESTTPAADVSRRDLDDSDPFRIDLDDLNSHSHSSTSFPSIHFAEETSQIFQEDSDDGTASVSPVSFRAPLPSYNTLAPPRILYIQMEFVERQTLKEAIEDGLSEDEAWKLFQQILDALVHMSTHGILHRDIKLTNIFIDGKGDCKVGDFGLATSSLAAVHPSDMSTSATVAEDMTSGVGTTLYVAPEVLSGRPGARNHAKADMYSLGIVFFEMNWQFKTGTERIFVLQALRQPEIIFPPGFDRLKQKEIITSLLQHDPKLRPTAVELSKSPLLPSRIEDTALNDALSHMVRYRSSAYHEALLEALFSQPMEPARTYIYDPEDDRPAQVAAKAMESAVQDRLASIFRLHGAIDMEPPLLIPATKLLKEESQVATFLDRHGDLVSLPRHTIISMGRLAARKGLQRIKRFHIGSTYRTNAAGGHPETHKVAVFDIITPDRAMGAEAESISVVHEALSAFPGVSSEQYDIHMSHFKIMDLAISRVPEEHRAGVISVLDQVKSTFPQKRALLTKMGLSRPLIDELEILLDVDDVETHLQRLETMSLSTAIVNAVEEIRQTVRLARVMGVNRRIQLRAWMGMRELFREGIVFEFVKVSPLTKRLEVIASGGRFDHLLEEFTPPTAPRPTVRAVGVELSVEKITMLLAGYQTNALKNLIKQHSFGIWSPRRCDVYIVSFQPGFLHERLELATLLWQNEISTDVMYDSSINATEENQVSMCSREGILFLVYLRSRTARRDLPGYKVKSVLKGTEHEVSRQELVNWLKIQIMEQKRHDRMVSEHATPIEPISITAAKEANDIQVIWPTDNHRKQRGRTKQIYFDKAFEMAAELKQCVQNSPPVVAVDVSPSAWAAMTANTSWITDDAAWRVVLAEFPPLQNANAQQIRETLARKKADGQRMIFFLSLRDDKLFLFHFP